MDTSQQCDNTSSAQQLVEFAMHAGVRVWSDRSIDWLHRLMRHARPAALRWHRSAAGTGRTCFRLTEVSHSCWLMRRRVREARRGRSETTAVTSGGVQCNTSDRGNSRGIEDTGQRRVEVEAAAEEVEGWRERGKAARREKRPFLGPTNDFNLLTHSSPLRL